MARKSGTTTADAELAFLGELAATYHVLDTLGLLPAGKLEEFDAFVRGTGGIADWREAVARQLAGSYGASPEMLRAAYRSCLEHLPPHDAALFVLRGVGCTRMPNSDLLPREAGAGPRALAPGANSVTTSG